MKGFRLQALHLSCRWGSRGVSQRMSMIWKATKPSPFEQSRAPEDFRWHKPWKGMDVPNPTKKKRTSPRNRNTVLISINPNSDARNAYSSLFNSIASMNGLSIDRMMTTSSCTKIRSAQIPFPGNALRSKFAGFIAGLCFVALGDLPKHANAMFEIAGCVQRSL